MIEEQTLTAPSIQERVHKAKSQRQERQKRLGGLFENLSEEEIVDLILLHKLTPEAHKISQLLNQALR